MDFNNYINDLKKVMDELNREEINNFLDLLVDAYKNENFVFV